MFSLLIPNIFPPENEKSEQFTERVRIMKKLLFKKCQFSLFCNTDKNYCTSTVWKKGFTKNRKLSDFLRNCNLYTFHVKVRKAMWNYRPPQKFGYCFRFTALFPKRKSWESQNCWWPTLKKLLTLEGKRRRREPASQY